MSSKAAGFAVLSTALVPLSIFLIVFMTQAWGLGVSPDSVNYLAAAGSLLEDGSLHGYRGTPLTLWPPLFPLLLAGIEALGLSPLATLAYLHGALLGGTALLSSLIIHAVTRSLCLAAMLGLAVAFSPELMYIGGYLWSEPLFTFLAIASVTATVFYLRAPSFARLALLAALCATAVLQRYAGVTLIAAAGLSILLLQVGSLRQRMTSCIMFGLAAALPTAVWLGRNLLATGSLGGERNFSLGLLPKAALESLRELGSWLLPLLHQDGLFLLLGFAFFVLVFFVLVSALRRRGEREDEALIVSAVYIAIYVLFIVYALLTACCVERFLAPLYPMFLVFVFLVPFRLMRYRKELSLQARKAFFGVGSIYALLLVSMNAAATYGLVEDFRANGRGYTARAWQVNEVIQDLRGVDLEKARCIYSNLPDALYFLLGPRCVAALPRKALYYHTQVALDERPQFFSRLRNQSEGALLVWFSGHRKRQFFEVPELQGDIEAELLSRSDDGAVYAVRERRN